MRSRGTTSIEVIKNICEAYSNGIVEIIVNHSEYSFVIDFVGSIGVPKAFDELDKTIEEIKKLEESIARRKKLLSNENYVNKAPKNIVDMDREKLKEEEERLAILKSK